jgi:hypothetical protein
MASGPKYFFHSKVYKITAVSTKVKIGDKRERFILLVINLSFTTYFFFKKIINDISISIFTKIVFGIVVVVAFQSIFDLEIH